jgi:hypothetical protein
VLSASVASVAQIVPPEFLIRETELKSVLSFIANTHGHPPNNICRQRFGSRRFGLWPGLRSSIRGLGKGDPIYTKDYEILGFGDYAA